jgi:hypothetical protein
MRIFPVLQRPCNGVSSRKREKPPTITIAKKMCDVLPQPLSSSCESFINQYVDEIIAEIGAAVDDICGPVGFCTALFRLELNSQMKHDST